MTTSVRRASLSPDCGDLAGGQHATYRRRQAAARRQRWRRLATRLATASLTGSWPLAGVLAAQTALTLRLVWSNTAFQDEGLYLWAGHLEWAHWLHHEPLPATPFATYMSGAPVIYPPLGSLLDILGGLAAARALSLCFMLGATLALHRVTSRLFGRRSAIFAAGLFAGTGSVQFLGAFATYDAMALFLLTLATWMGVRAADARPAAAGLLLAGSGGVLAVADAAKYAAALFDPVVLAVILLACWRERGARDGVAAAVVTATTAALCLGAALLAGGAAYRQGIAVTTLARQPGGFPAPGVLFDSARWVGVVAAAAVVGAIAVPLRGNGTTKALAVCLTAAVFLAPAAQARIGVITSLFKHVGYGAWFGSVVAGYGLAALSAAVPLAKARAALRTSAVCVLAAAVPGIYLASAHFSGWPRATPLIAALKPRVAAARGPMLLDAPSVDVYYLRGSLDVSEVFSNYYFAYTDPRTGKHFTSPAAAYSAAIANRYFSLVALTYSPDPAGFDSQIKSAIDRDGGYRLVASVPFKTATNDGHFLIYVRRPAAAVRR